jgi:hypothetical protein
MMANRCCYKQATKSPSSELRMPTGWHFANNGELMLTNAIRRDRHHSKFAIIRIWRSGNDDDLDVTVSRTAVPLY